MPVERRVPAHRPRYRFHPYVRPAAARHRRWGVVGGSIATITTIAAATTPATTVIPAAAATSAPSVTTMTSMTMVWKPALAFLYPECRTLRSHR